MESESAYPDESSHSDQLFPLVPYSLTLDVKMFEEIAEEGQARQRELSGQHERQVVESSNSNSYEKHEAEAQNLIDPELYRYASSNLNSSVETFVPVLNGIATKEKLTPCAILKGVTPSNNTLLHVAANFDQCYIAEYIAGVCPSLLTRTNSRRDTALHLAARAGHGSMAQILFHVKCDQLARNTATEEYVNKELLRSVNDDGNTALHEALIHGHVDLAQDLIKADPEVSFYVNEENKSPFYLAVEAGHKECIAQMLQKPADTNVNERLHSGKSAIHLAIINAATKRHAKDILDFMMEKEPQLIHLRDEDQRTALHLAASIGYLEGVLYLLKKHGFAYIHDKNGLLPIHVASIEGHVAIIEEFLGYSPYREEMLTTNFQNILHVAAKSGSDNVVSYILKDPKLETLINQRDRDKNTPLHLAAMYWHPKIVSTLTRDKRVNLELVNKKGFTALDAVEYNMEEMPPFRKRLTWAALRAAGTPRAPFRDTLTKEKFVKSGPSVHTESRKTDNYKERVNTLLLVSTLIATITFAAGFTAPGGYNESGADKGMATLLKHKEFFLFILCDMIAMYSSITVAVALIWAQLGDQHLVLKALRFSLPLLGVALVMMSLAFMAGIYLVVKKLQWLGYLVFVTGSLFLVVLSLLFFPLSVSHSSSNRILRFMFSYAFNLLVLLTSSRTSSNGSS